MANIFSGLLKTAATFIFFMLVGKKQRQSSSTRDANNKRNAKKVSNQITTERNHDDSNVEIRKLNDFSIVEVPQTPKPMTDVHGNFGEDDFELRSPG